jgi:hypothetical protein
MNLPEYEAYIDVAAFSVNGDQLQTLVAPSESSTAMWQLGVPEGVIEERDSQTLSLDAIALRAVRSVIADPPHAQPIVIEQLEAIKPEDRVLRVGYLAVVPNVKVPGRQWVNSHNLTRGQLSERDLSLVELAIQRLQEHVQQGFGRNELSPLTAFLPPEMTIPQLRATAEAIMNQTYDAGNFARKIQASPGLLPIVTMPPAVPRIGRPAQVYRYQRPASSRWP